MSNGLRAPSQVFLHSVKRLPVVFRRVMPPRLGERNFIERRAVRAPARFRKPLMGMELSMWPGAGARLASGSGTAGHTLRRRFRTCSEPPAYLDRPVPGA